MRVTKWVDMGADVEIEIGADDVRRALDEAFSETEQRLEYAVNIHDVLRAFNSIGQFLNALTDEQIALLNDAQRKVIGAFLNKAASRFPQTTPEVSPALAGGNAKGEMVTEDRKTLLTGGTEA